MIRTRGMVTLPTKERPFLPSLKNESRLGDEKRRGILAWPGDYDKRSECTFPKIRVDFFSSKGSLFFRDIFLSQISLESREPFGAGETFRAVFCIFYSLI